MLLCLPGSPVFHSAFRSGDLALRAPDSDLLAILQARDLPIMWASEGHGWQREQLTFQILKPSALPQEDAELAFAGLLHTLAVDPKVGLCAQAYAKDSPNLLIKLPRGRIEVGNSFCHYAGARYYAWENKHYVKLALSGPGGNLLLLCSQAKETVPGSEAFKDLRLRICY